MPTESSRERRELADLIKKARTAVRTAAGRRMTQRELGDLIGYSQGNINKIESAAVPIEPDTVEKIIMHTRASAETAARMRDLAPYAAVGAPYSGARRATARYATRYIQAEVAAREILSWHELRLPGPLQSEHFMLRQFGTRPIDVSPLMRRRLDRRRIFHQPDLHRYNCVLAQEALDRAYHAFGREVMLDELDYLLRLNDPDDPRYEVDTRTCVQVLPAERGLPHLPGDFSILRPIHGKDFVYVEHVAGADYPDSPDGVGNAQRAWDELQGAALDRHDTNDFLRRLRCRLAG